MSGDTQPRKRKDKKRRKEDEGSPIHPTLPMISNNQSSSDDVNIHVHKEDGLGGGICAKLIFFVLFSALAVVIGLIITEHRGLTDVDIVDTNSKFSQIFEGWTDSNIDHHEDDQDNIEDVLSEEHHDHDDDEIDTDDDATDEHDLDEDEHEDKDEEDDEHSLDEDDETVEDQTAEDDTELSQEEMSDEVYKYDENDEDETNEIDEDVERSEEKDFDEDEESKEVEDEETKEDDEEEAKENYETDNASEELDDISREIEYDNAPEEEDDDDIYQIEKSEEVEKEDSAEELDKENSEEIDQRDSNEEQDNEDSEEDDDVDNRDVREERSAEVVSNDGDQTLDDDEDDNDDLESSNKDTILTSAREPDDDDVKESSGMAVKVGVGVALLVVAHLVLCRKWRSVSDDKPSTGEAGKEPTPDLSRRNTIIVPPTFQEVEQDIDPDDEDYSEEEEEDISDEEEIEPRTVKERYAELRSTYTRTLSPEGETISQPISYEDDNEYEDEIEDEISDEEEEEEEEDLEEAENDEEYEEEDNEELLKRLDAKYGKLPSTEASAKRPFKSAELGETSSGYVNRNITSKEDFQIRDEIDDAQNTIQNNPSHAVKLFDKILEKFPSSPRSIYGKAMALNRLADQRRSNDILYRAIELYIKLLSLPNVPEALFHEAMEKTITVMRFVGQYKSAIDIQKRAINAFPDMPKYYNDLVVTYLTINSIEGARTVLRQVLQKWPNDGFALVHQGFILKTVDNKLEEAVHYLKLGIATNDPGVIDGRFFFHLGDALERLGRHDEATQVYQEGTRQKVFLSKYQRSLYNVARLTGRPFWEEHELPYQDLFRYLKQNWHMIRDEGLSVLNKEGYFKDESENLRDKGKWKQFELFARGQKNLKNCAKTPLTCSLIEKVSEAKGCKRGQTKFSVMDPGTHVWPHCGPTNCRLRIHLGLKVPFGTWLRVADEIRSWEDGNIIIFDDSFEHEVWHNGSEFRLVLIVDVWHHELTAVEKRSLSPI